MFNFLENTLPKYFSINIRQIKNAKEMVTGCEISFRHWYPQKFHLKYLLL